jgi:hypothetical protein
MSVMISNRTRAVKIYNKLPEITNKRRSVDSCVLASGDSSQWFIEVMYLTLEQFSSIEMIDYLSNCMWLAFPSPTQAESK